MSIPRSKIIIRVLRFWQRHIRRAFKQLGLPEYTVFSIFSIITGIAAGFSAVGFHHAIHYLSVFFLEMGPELLTFMGAGAIIIIPMIGMLLQSGLIALAPDTSSKRSVLEVIKAITIRGGFIRLRTTLFHFIAPAISIGSGATVGPEGPVAQIGAGVSSKLSRLFGLSESRRRMFTAAGSGAAIAAVFNTPLGGVFFALEVILLNDFQTPTFSALILASVTASAISQTLLGNEPAFLFHGLEIGSPQTYYLYAVLGLGAGLLSLLFIKYSEKIDWLLNSVLIKKLPQWAMMALVGLLIGICGYFYRDILGIGYVAINKILAGELSWQVIVILLVMKFVLVPLVLKSGGFGGIFAPSLFIGATYGYLFAFAMNTFFGLQLNTIAFTLVGMGAVLGGVNSIPIAAIMIIFEMTKEYSFILPLMLGVVTSTTLTHLIVRGSIHSKHLEQQGFRISGGTEMNILRSLSVGDVLKKDAILIPQDTPLPHLIRHCIESPHETFFTVDEQQNLSGMISLSDLRPMITEYEHLRQMIIARDIAEPCSTTVTTENNLEYVLTLFDSNMDLLPVVNRKNPQQVIGTVARQDVIKAYQQESLRYNIADSFAHSLKNLPKAQSVQVAEGYSIVERTVPKHFIGKSIQRLKIRNRYGIEILMIKQQKLGFGGDQGQDMTEVSPNYTIREGDTLLIFGPDEKIAKTAGWEPHLSDIGTGAALK